MKHPIITVPKPNPNAQIQLLCIPYAGGGARSFLQWPSNLPHVELGLISYPGREHRITEETIVDIDILLQTILEGCKNFINKNFVIFGHSMGSIISYGLATKLEEEEIFPKLLIVSSAASPIRHLREDDMLSTLPDDKFIKILVERYEAIPDVVLKDKELVKMFTRVLRTDISMEEQYCRKYGTILDEGLHCDIAAFGGIKDIFITENHLITWQTLTKGKFTKKMFPGTHFYINESTDLLLSHIDFMLKN